MNELHLFAGSGGGILGGILLGHTCVCAVEIEPYCRRVLLQRQRDGILPKFPIWDDIRTFDGRPWRGLVDVVAGGFPCKDISSARGANAKGIHGKHSRLWFEMARIICEIRPGFVFVENSPLLVHRGLATVLGDIARMGYDAKWGVLGADDVGAPHHRKRMWILANNHRIRCSGRRFERQGMGRHHQTCDETFTGGKTISNVTSQRRGQVEQRDGIGAQSEGPASQDQQSVGSWWKIEPALGRMADGVADRVDRIRSLGNGQVPAVVKLAWETLSQ